MNKFLLFFVAVLMFCKTSAQTEGITYQAVIVDLNAQQLPGIDVPASALPNKDLTVRFSLIDSQGSLEYQEEQATTTDAFGMIHLIIGKGTPVTSQSFTEIYWIDEKTLQVAIDLNDGNGFINFSTQPLHYVPYVNHREIIATSTLDVDGETNLNNNLTVNNQSTTRLTGDLYVEGSANFDQGNFKNLVVTETSGLNQVNIAGATTIDGTTSINNSLSVTNNNPVNFSGNLNVEGQASFQNTDIANLHVRENFSVGQGSQFYDQVIISAEVNGDQNSTDSYPLLVRGSNQGIHIRVDGVSNNTNNFMSFADASRIKGAIEGQTLQDLRATYEYGNDRALYYKNIAFITAEGVACSTQLDFVEAGIMAAQIITELAFEIDLILYAENNRGIYFKSGGADYAEYLPHLDLGETFNKGDVVGVFGGQISKNTSGASKIMVISSNPIVLGNFQEGKAMQGYEKVAFLGQVPVRVYGKVVVGDYILASGNNDGAAVAKNKAALSLSDYENIVGVAWEASTSKPVNMINTAVGINQNDLVIQLKQQRQELDELKKTVAGLLERIDGKTTNPDTTKTETSLKPEAFYKPDQKSFDSWLAENEATIKHYIEHQRELFVQNNIDLSRYPNLQRWINDPINTLKAYNNGSLNPTMWQQVKRQMNIK